MSFQDTKLSLDHVTAGSSRCLQVGEKQVGLFRTADGLFAIDNVCPHRGAPLHEGHVVNGVVTCPWHQWHFQLRDGVCQNIPGARVPAYPLEVREGTIWIDAD